MFLLAGFALAISMVSITGCASFQTYTGLEDGQRPYKIIDSKRYVSGPFGRVADVHSTIEAVKHHSVPSTVSARAVQLPNQPGYALLEIFDYEFPKDCGSHYFRVYEGEDLQILEYVHPVDGVVQAIRDYVVGPSPFIEAGLWTPYDHTAASVRQMQQLSGKADEDGLGFLPGTYDIGMVTMLAKDTQLELGVEYRRAVRAASKCIHVAAR